MKIAHSGGLLALALAVSGCGAGSAETQQEGATDDGAIGQITQHATIAPRLTMSASPAAQDDRFGTLVALDENIGVGTSVPQTGNPATYVFTRADMAWSAPCKLPLDFSGAVVRKFSGTPSFTVIAGRGPSAPNKIVIYRNTGTACGSWVNELNATPPTSVTAVQAVAIDQTGTKVATANGTKVVLYTRGASTWTAGTPISAPAGATLKTIALSTDKGIVAGDPVAGKVWSVPNGSTTWTQIAGGSSGIPGTGTSLAIYGIPDTSIWTLAIGSPTPSQRERVTIAEASSGTWETFVDILNPAGATHTRFGASVATQNYRLVIGAPDATVGSVGFAGKAYSYKRNDTLWVLQHVLNEAAPADHDGFGAAVGVTGRSAWVGNPKLDTGLPHSPPGAIYEYSLDWYSRYEPATRTAHFGNGTSSDLVAVGYQGFINAGSSNGVTDVFGGFATGVAARPQKVLTDNVPAADPYLMAISVAWGRVNGDGFADLIAGGAYRAVTGLARAGGIAVYPGSSTGLSSAFRTLLDRATDGDMDPRTDARSSDTFGAAVATGDFDDDGFDDVAVGTPGDAASPGGGVQVFSGGTPSGIGAQKTLLPYYLQRIAAGYAFGSVLAAGDFNCDGYEDLAVSAPYAATGFSTIHGGAVYVFSGSQRGLVILGSTISASSFGETPVEDDLFGSSLAVGNFNGDMFRGIPCADLVIGARRRDVAGTVDVGAAYIRYGSGYGSNVLLAINQSSIAGEDAAASDSFGAGVSALPNGTLTDDLIVGAPGEDGSGAVFLFKGASGGIAVSTVSRWTQNTPNVPEAPVAGDLWGWAVAGLGGGAVAIGVPGKDVGGIADTGGVAMVRYTYSAPSFTAASGLAYHQAHFTTAPAPFNTNVAGHSLGLELLKPRSGR
jgi:hypothetical protein